MELFIFDSIFYIFIKMEADKKKKKKMLKVFFKNVTEQFLIDFGWDFF